MTKRTASPHQHGFLPGRSRLSNLLAFEEAVTRMMDEGHTVNFDKAFDSANHSPSQLTYCRIEMVAELAPSDQSC